MKTYKVSVTKTDIKKGCRYKSRNCPVARAMERAIGRPVSVYSGGGFAFLHKRTLKKLGKEHQVSGVVGDFILDFDRGLEVEPFKFTVSV
jgi:hypothetical protein